MLHWIRTVVAGPLLIVGGLAIMAPIARAEVPVGAGLEPAFALLASYDQAQGAGLVEALDAAAVQINWSRGRAPGGQATAFLPRGGAVITSGTIFVDSQLVDASAESLAAILAHEARHAVDLLQAGRTLDPAACLESEVRAHDEQARAWAFLVGPNGLDPASTPLEQDLNDLLLTSANGPQAVQEWIIARGLSRC